MTSTGRAQNGAVPRERRAEIAALMRSPDRGARELGLARLEEALERTPVDSGLLLARAQCLLGLGQLRDARAAAAAAAKCAPPDPLYWDAVATIFSRAGEQWHALEAYRRALRLAPDDARVLFNRAAVRRYVGELALAESDYDAVIARDPRDYEAYRNRSELRVQTEARNHISELEALLAGEPLPWLGEVQVRYALAKEYEDLGRHERAFEHLERGSRLRRQHLRYDVRADEQTVEWIIESFPSGAPPEESPAESSGGESAERPIFIVGLPRSGSTVVDRILSSHSQVSSAGELDCFARVLVEAAQRQSPRRMSRRELVLTSATLDFPQLGREYMRRARAAGAEGRCFVDKMPLNFLYCGLIRRALPHARIVHVSRSPMSACYGVYKSLFEAGYPYSYDLTELGKYYIAYQRLMAHWQRTLPGAIHALSYECLVRDQIGETRRLLEFCGLEWEEACLAFHRNPAPTTTASAAQVRRPLYDVSVSQWRRYARQLSGLREQLRAAGIDCEDPVERAG
jgi:tetratricopeptide (TPR) repeat protein